jgi:hypothetical protein
LEGAGTARGQITEHGIKEFESGSVAISIVVSVKEYWDTETSTWVNCEADDYYTAGDIILVKKDGTPNNNQVEALCKYAGWDGDIAKVGSDAWQPTPCAVVINADEYKGVTNYKISWLNEYDRTPGAVGNCTPEKARELADRYGAQFRALAGNVTRNATAPTGKPKPPKPPTPSGSKAKKPAPATKQPDNTISGVGTGVIPEPQSGDDIPF